MKRWGFKRAFGPFAHPICAGYFFAMTVPISFWLWRTKYFKNNLFGLFCFLSNLGGCLFAISRAPIASMIMSFAFVWYGWSKKRKTVLLVLATVGIVCSIIILPKFIEYISADRATAQTEDQRNAAYRSEMMQNYYSIVGEKPLFGWGRFGVPVVDGQVSIDNEYLYVALTSGLVPLGAYIIFMLMVIGKILWVVVNRNYNNEDARLCWCFLGSWFAAMLTQYTVYAGLQTVQIFYMFGGVVAAIALGHETYQGDDLTESQIEKPKGDYAYQFSRTL